MDTPTTLTISTIGSDSFQEKKQVKIYPQIFAAFAATISAFGMGLCEAFPSPGIPSMEANGKLGFLSLQQKSMIASLALFAAMASGLPMGFIIGKIGRKSSLMILSIPCVAGWLLIASAINMEMMYIGRILTGFAAGAASLVVPIFIGEIAEDRIRGMLCSGFQLMVTLGNAVVYLLGTFIEWQWLALFCGMVPLFSIILMVFVPPSPIFLMSRGRVYDAMGALMSLRGTKQYRDVETEFLMIKQNLETCNAERKSYRDVFKIRTIRPMVICILLLVLQQASGIEAILVFTVFIFDQAGPNINSYYCTIFIGFLQVIATLISASLVDRAGRRILLMISELGVALTMLSLGIFFYLKIDDPTLMERLEWVPLVSLGLFIIFFALGLGPIPWIIVLELNSAAVIGIASAVCTTLNWTFASLITLFFIDIQIQVGLHWCFAMFSLFSFIGIAFVYVFVPETKGKSMEEIQNYFRKNKVTISPKE